MQLFFSFSNVQPPPPPSAFKPTRISCAFAAERAAGELASGPQRRVGVEEKHPSQQQKQDTEEQSHDLPQQEQDEEQEEEEDEEQRPGVGQVQASPPADSGRPRCGEVDQSSSIYTAGGRGLHDIIKPAPSLHTMQPLLCLFLLSSLLLSSLLLFSLLLFFMCSFPITCGRPTLENPAVLMLPAKAAVEANTVRKVLPGNTHTHTHTVRQTDGLIRD